MWNRKRTASAAPFNGLVLASDIPIELIDILDSIDAEYILLDGYERVTQSSVGISTFNIIREYTLLN